MQSKEIRSEFLKFYKERGHTIIPSAKLVPENDPTTLFTGSGMQPLVPYLLGQKHPLGTRLVNSQKAFRSGDIDDIGDNRHFTFFEMLGNWSLGDYFKNEQIPWVFEFLTDRVKIDPKKLYVTVFIGDETNNIPKDTEAVAIWKKLFAEKGIEAKDVEMGSEANAAKVGMQGGRIFYYDAKKNWWSRAGVPQNMPAGEPGGPDSEMFYEFTDVKHDTKFGEHCHPNCDCGRFLEIGNSVFMEYQKNADGTFSKLPQKNVDFGGGFERIAAVAHNTSDMFRIDVFSELITTLETRSGKRYDDPAYTASFRVIADHLRSSVFLIGDGVNPSNADQGYFVRRLLRRAIRFWDKLGIADGGLSGMVDALLEYYKEAYPDTFARKADIIAEIDKEESKFRATLKNGLKEFEKIAETVSSSSKLITGEQAFVLFSSYGFPFEIVKEIAKERGLNVDEASFAEEMKKHQDLSRAGSLQKFKGGLADTSDMSLRYHTATHLLNAALRKTLGTHVGQKGSNITPERLRFDFSHPQKMTKEEIDAVAAQVNEWIAQALPVGFVEMPKNEAESVAVHAFGEKYGDVVKVYSVGDEKTGCISREFCGGPHVNNTSELAGPEKTWKFIIQKEEAVSQGVRRIKAVLQ
jgi:alanyl-tRNA synthetase